MRPVIEFRGGGPIGSEGAVACDVGDGTLVLRGVAVRLTDGAVREPGSALFAIAGGRLSCEDVVVRMPGHPMEDSGSFPGLSASCVLVRGTGTAAAAISMIRSRAAGEAVFLRVAPAVSGTVTMDWNGGEFLSPRRLVLAEGVPSGHVQVDCTLHEATFCCGDGIVASADSLDRPEPPRLRVRATGCRFMVTGHDRPFVLQAGVGEPDRYRAALSWIDEGSRYEGHAVFQRIDGAAERIDVGFREILPPLAHDERVGPCPTPDGWPGW